MYLFLSLSYFHIYQLKCIAYYLYSFLVVYPFFHFPFLLFIFFSSFTLFSTNIYLSISVCIFLLFLYPVSHYLLSYFLLHYFSAFAYILFPLFTIFLFFSSLIFYLFTLLDFSFFFFPFFFFFFSSPTYFHVVYIFQCFCPFFHLSIC